ncbi:MAG: hypothetical protein EOM54_10265 [Clostridia bacterium]|nr:hypothetical protein [Clostridia bacterium]
MDNDGVVSIDTTGRTHKIQLGTASVEGEIPPSEQAKVSYVIKNFLGKSAQELEAITTLDYAAVNILKGKAGDEQIIEQVLRIKGSKFQREYLSEELELLKREGFVGCLTGIAAG